MSKIRRGTEVQKRGKWYGRVRYTLPNGKRKDIWMPASDKTHAARLVTDKLAELKVTGESDINSDRVTFEQLVAKYKDGKLFPAKIVNGRKVAGLKSVGPALAALKPLQDWFAKQRIKTITHADVQTYKLKRFETPTIHGGQRQISSVNRELELLRAMMRFAVRLGWLVRSPFEMGDPLISKADETKRERVLSHDEERRLLDACLKRDKQGRQRWLHIRAILITALDTSARRDELFKLRWRDVNFANRTISIIAENCKTARPRIVGMTHRVLSELTSLWEVSGKDLEALVFGVTNTIKTGWKTVCREAGVEDYHWHDGRHTGTTRMVSTRQPSAVVMKVTGHTQFSTFSRYVNPDAGAVLEVATALDSFNLKATEAQATTAPELIN
jgi:integrase